MQSTLNPLTVFGYRQLTAMGYGSRKTVWQKVRAGEFPEPAFYLGDKSSWLMVGEGIETCLAAMQATSSPAWAALSTSGLLALQLRISHRYSLPIDKSKTPNLKYLTEFFLRN